MTLTGMKENIVDVLEQAGPVTTETVARP